MPEVGSGFIGFDDAAVIGVGDEGVSAREPACEGDAAEGYAADRAGECGYNFTRSPVRDLNRAVVVLVRNENVAVLKQFSGVGIVKLTWAHASDAGLSVLPGDSLIVSDFDHALIGLVSNEHIPVRQKGVLHGRIELVRAGAGYPKMAVLPDNVAGLIDQQNTVVCNPIWDCRDDSRRYAGARHQGKCAHSFGIIGADNRAGREIGWTVSKVPDDFTSVIDLNNAVIKLIGDKNVASLVEFAVCGRDSGRAENEGDTE